MNAAYGVQQAATAFQRHHEESRYSEKNRPPTYESSEGVTFPPPSESDLLATKGRTDVGFPQAGQANEEQKAEKSWFGRGISKCWNTAKKARADAAEFCYKHQPLKFICQFTVLTCKATCFLAKGTGKLIVGAGKAILATPDFIEKDLPRVLSEIKIRGKAIGKNAIYGGAAGAAAGAGVSIAIMGPSALVAGPLGVVPAAVPTMLGLTAGIAAGTAKGCYVGKEKVEQQRLANLLQQPEVDHDTYNVQMNEDDMRDFFADANVKGESFEVIFKERIPGLEFKDKYV